MGGSLDPFPPRFTVACVSYCKQASTNQYNATRFSKKVRHTMRLRSEWSPSHLPKPAGVINKGCYADVLSWYTTGAVFHMLEMMVADIMSFPSNRAIVQRHNAVAYVLLSFLLELSDRTRPDGIHVWHVAAYPSKDLSRYCLSVRWHSTIAIWYLMTAYPQAEALCSLAGRRKTRGYARDLPDGFAVSNYYGIPHVCCQHALAGVH